MHKMCIRDSSRISDELRIALEKAVPGDKRQILFNTERGTVHLALRVSGINIKDEELRILALSDINRELDEREIDSWIPVSYTHLDVYKRQDQEYTRI